MNSLKETTDALLWRILTDPANLDARLELGAAIYSQGGRERSILINVGHALATGRYAEGCTLAKARNLQKQYTCLALRDWREVVNQAPPLPDLPYSVSHLPRWHNWVRVGFLEQVELTAETFMAVAVPLFKTLPITRVRLLDVHAYAAGEVPSWMPDGGDSHMVLPSHDACLTTFSGILAPVLEHMKPGPHKTRRDARLALSDACVEFGRAMVELPSLRNKP